MNIRAVHLGATRKKFVIVKLKMNFLNLNLSIEKIAARNWTSNSQWLNHHNHLRRKSKQTYNNFSIVKQMFGTSKTDVNSVFDTFSCKYFSWWLNIKSAMMHQRKIISTLQTTNVVGLANLLAKPTIGKCLYLKNYILVLLADGCWGHKLFQIVPHALTFLYHELPPERNQRNQTIASLGWMNV